MIFYKIKKENGVFRVLLKNDNTLMLELKCEDVNKVFQYDHAILAEKKDGEKTKYDLYLPETTYRFEEHRYCLSSVARLVVSDISDYCYYHGILAFSFRNNWRFMFLKNFEMELFTKNDFNLVKRLQQLPSIPCRKGAKGFFKEEFTNSICDTLYVVFCTDDVDFLLSIKANQVPLYSSGITVSQLGTAETLSGGKGIYFKAIDETGEYWHEFFRKSGPYGKIEEFAESDYPAVYPSTDFTGYWRKDKDGLIAGITFLENFGFQSFSITFPVSARKVHFVKQLTETDQKNPERKITKAELWEFYTAHMEKLYLLFSRENNHYTVIDPKDLLED